MKPVKPAPIRQTQPSPAEVNALLALYNARRYAEAESRARSLVGQFPDFGFGWKLLGGTLQMQGKDALPAFQKVAELMPDDAEAHYNLGVVLKSLGRLEDAVASYRRAVALKPDYAEAYGNLGNSLKDLGRLDEAVASFRRALIIKPDSPNTHNNLGAALKELGQLDNAASSYRRAAQLKHDFAEEHNRQGVTLMERRQFDRAEASFRHALQFKPDFAPAHNNLGVALMERGKLEDAMASYRRAVELKPDFAEPHNNLGMALQDLSQLDDAAASYRRALEIKPDLALAYSNLLYMQSFAHNTSPELERSLAANWENAILNESERIAARSRAFSFANPPRSDRKLRVGVVSAELGLHAVAEFLEPLLEQLDRSRFHVTLYPTASRLEPRADQLKKLADEYKSLVGLSDKNASDQIRSERIDILIDTTAHMRNCRLGIFAHRAAPVQCHYIGYHGTTGLTEMDWFIGDEVLLPSSCNTHFREGIWRLPRLWVAYRGDASLPDSRWEPSLDGTVWLGSFNNLVKVREEALALWAKVMNAIPEARLLLKDRQAKDTAIQDRIKTELGRHGISPERIEFAAWTSDWRSHMALYDRLDIALDTIPLNSGTTAFDALWMGVPLAALEGNWMGARMTNAILKALGKPEWVAQNEDEYVAIVAALARDAEGRKSLRAAQRALMAASPLCDAKELTRALEDAFERMFDRWMEKCESARKESGTK